MDNKARAAQSTGAQPNERGAVAPYTASPFTRILYCLALLAILAPSLAQNSWIGLATGGGLLGFGQVIFFLVIAGVLYRVYLVARYREVLNARPPNAFGWLLRGLGWMVMFGGVLGLASLFFVRPLTLALLKSAGDNGIGYFVVGLGAVMLAGSGWIGCVLFEVSRAAGKRVASRGAETEKATRKQDLLVLAGFVTLAIAVPFAPRVLFGAPCYGPTMTRCAATVEGGLIRMAMVPHGSPVALQSNIEEVEFRKDGTPNWSLKESPAFSLAKAGHPADNASTSPVRVVVKAESAGQGAVVVLQVIDGGQQTARFTTLFQKDAKVEPRPEGGRRLIVNLGRNVEIHGRTTFPGPDKQLLSVDELYSQMRQAIGSQREVDEASRQVTGKAVLLSSATPDPSFKYVEGRPAKNCDGKVKLTSGDAETSLLPSPGSPLARAHFVAAPEPGTYALLHHNDQVTCHGDGVWLVGLTPPRRDLQIRRYDMNGLLVRYVVVTLPTKKDEYDWLDHASFREIDGAIEFQTVVSGTTSTKRIERYKISL